MKRTRKAHPSLPFFPEREPQYVTEITLNRMEKKRQAAAVVPIHPRMDASCFYLHRHLGIILNGVKDPLFFFGLHAAKVSHWRTSGHKRK
jgi:hypothetical protein